MRRFLWIALLLVAAQPVRSEPIQTLAQAYAAAWQRQPAGQAVAERENALRSRRLAADALTPEPPSIELRVSLTGIMEPPMIGVMEPV